jgi:transcriptional regulator with XRE-family HTH domain
MEFNEKLVELRKAKGITQEALAESLYVSRTAISKWESGRGYPNIDSLKAIAKFFSVTVDELISSEQAIRLAESDAKKKENRLRDTVFGLADISAVLLFFLPLFREVTEGKIKGATLLEIGSVNPFFLVLYYITVSILMLSGLLTLTLSGREIRLYEANKYKLSLCISVFGTLLFSVSLHPYAVAFIFIFLIIKGATLLNFK